MGMPLITQNFPVIYSGPRVQGEYWLVDTMAQGSLKLSTDTYFRPLGLHHFYEAFSIEGKATLRQDARAQFGLKEAELTSDLRLTAAAVLRMQWGQHKEQPKAPPARTARRDRVPPGVISPEQGEEERGADEEEASVTCTDSEHSSNEQDELPQDATRTPLNEDSHQHGLMLAAYREVGSDFSVDSGQLVKGLEALKWPLARLTVPLLKSVEYLDRVLAGCCWEVLISRKTQMTPLVRCEPQKASLSHWQAIWQISLLRPCEPPGHRKEVPWQMRKTFTFCVQISGSNPFTRSCCMLPLDIMSVEMEKGSGRVVGLWKSWPSQGVPRLEYRLRTQRVLLRW